MAFSFFPRTVKFFDLFQNQNRKLVEAANMLEELVSECSNLKDRCHRIGIVDGEGDIISREIARELATTFITPIDREDIHEINMAQKEAVNRIKKLAYRFILCRMDIMPAGTRELTVNIKLMSEETGKMLAKLGRRDDVDMHVGNVKRLAAQCEVFMGVSLSELYANKVSDPEMILEIFKWTQVYNRFERAVQRIDHLANTIEGVKLKNA